VNVGPRWVTEPLDAQHGLRDFDCGEVELNVWLSRYALANQRNDSSKTRVVCDDMRNVIAYYSLAAGSVDRDEAPERISKGLAGHPIPVAVLTRLAVDTRHQGTGLGRFLLRDALTTVAEISERMAIRALLIHAKTSAARDWYLKQAEFDEMPGLPRKLLLLTKDLRKAVAGE
jgi:GNAT superfamily N-acetyltransferase